MKNTLMKDAFRTIGLALIVGALAGAGAATYVLGVDAQGKIGHEFNARNGRQHLELGPQNTGHATGDATGRPPRFWGLQVGAGDSLTAIGVYTDRPATGAPYVPPAKLSPKLPE